MTALFQADKSLKNAICVRFWAFFKVNFGKNLAECKKRLL